jgi:heterodisulfide reductase subunit A
MLASPALWPDVAHVAVHDVLCSDEGKAALASEMATHHLDRVVLAGCSPHEHETTFRGVLGGAGCEPYHLCMVNLREQAEWVGGDPVAATFRARALVRAGVGRVRLHRPLLVREIDISPDVVVVGSGVAGISAALALADDRRRVLLVERDFAVGGRIAQIDQVFPGGQCASCFVEPALARVLDQPGIQVMTGTEITSVRGAHGCFTVGLVRRPRYVDPNACLGTGECAAACPVEVTDPLSPGRGKRKAIGVPYSGCLPHAAAVDAARCLHFGDGSCADACVKACPMGAVRFDEQPLELAVTCGAVVIATGAAPGALPMGDPDVLGAFELERALHPNGPSRGEVRCADGSVPARVLLGLLESTSARDAEVGRPELAKLARTLHERLPGVTVTLTGRGLGALALPPGAVTAEAPVVRLERLADGLAVHLAGEGEARRTDLAVLFTPLVPAAPELARTLHLQQDAAGFVPEQGDPFAPTATRIAGVYVAGSAAGARSLAAAIRDGAAAAAQVLTRLHPGKKLGLDPLVAAVDPDRCSGCALCVGACPFGAMSLDDERARVEPAHCRACGSCAATCPSRAMITPHYTDEQLRAEIASLLAVA